MAPSKWDDEEEESSSGSEESVQPVAVVAPVRRKFDDEEDSDEVVDSWDAEDSEEERKKVAKVAAAKAKAEAEAAANKKSKSQRIEEHREAARRRRAAEEGDESSDDEDEDAATRRARLRATEQEADLKHAQDLFDNVGLGVKSRSAKGVVIEDNANPGQTIDLSQIALFKPATKTQFEALSSALVPLLAASSAKPHYSLWAQDFVKKLVAELPSTEIKKAASGLTALSNEKLKEEKAQEKGGKKTKAAKTKTTLSAGRDLGRGAADTNAYDEDGLDDGDFM